MPYCTTRTYTFAPGIYTSPPVSYTEIISKTPLETRKSPRFLLFLQNSHFNPQQLLSFLLLLKTGRLTIPISRIRYGITHTTTQISLQRRFI